MSCLRSYDDLCEALEAYEACGLMVCVDEYEALRAAARRCGIDVSGPFIAAAKLRRATYRATVTGAVAHLNAVITSLEIDQ